MTRFEKVRSRLLAGPPKLAATLTLGAVFVGAPTLLRLAAGHMIGGTSFVTYYPLVLLAAVFIGWRGAAAVAILSALIANLLFMAPQYDLLATVGGAFATAFFLLSCSMMIAVVDALRRAVREAEAGRKLLLELHEEIGQRLAAIGLAAHSLERNDSEATPLAILRGAVDEAWAQLRRARSFAEG